jgi:hypothetical protein
LGVKPGETECGGMMSVRVDAGTAEPRVIGLSEMSIRSR